MHTEACATTSQLGHRMHSEARVVYLRLCEHACFATHRGPPAFGEKAEEVSAWALWHIVTRSDVSHSPL